MLYQYELGPNITVETVEISTELNDDQKNYLINRFGPDVLDFQKYVGVSMIEPSWKLVLDREVVKLSK